MDDIATVIGRNAALTPKKASVVFEDTAHDWRRFDTAVSGAAAYLAERAAGDRIALTLPNSMALALGVFGSIRGGKAVQILDPAWPETVTRSVLEALQPSYILDKRNIDEFESALGVDAVFAHSAFPEADKFSTFYTGFTSGSTGLPKGFRRDQNSWLESFRGDRQLFRFSDKDVFVALGSMVHSLFMYALIRGVYAGGTTIFFRQFRPNRILRRLHESKASVIYGVPTQLDALAAASRPSGLMLSDVRLVLSSGAKLPIELAKRLRKLFPNAEICEFYGTSEHSYITVAREGKTPLGSVGQAFPGVRITIRDETGVELPRGENGRVFVESDLMFQDYELAENPTIERHGRELFVGDLGHVAHDGNLYLVGRSDRMLVSSGKNIYPEEIEAILMTHPEVTMACVIGVEDSRRGVRLAAIIRPSAKADLESSALITWCRDHLPDSKVPMSYFIRDDWPMTASQKSDIPRLQTLLTDGALEPLS